MKTPYRYTVLRYVHDVITGEFLNVGVLMHAPAQKYVGARFLLRWKRIRSVFPDLDGQSLRDMLRYVQAQYASLSERLEKELPLSGESQSVETIAESVIRSDDSSLQWSPAGCGIAEDLNSELEWLYGRLVGRYETAPRHQARDEDDVWAEYKRDLAACEVTSHLHARTVTLGSHEAVFNHTWRGDRWVHLEPISLDLVDRESIKAKGYRWLGEMTMLAPALEDVTLYLLIGEARNEACRPAMDAAINTLNRIPVRHEIVRENASADLSSQLARLIRDRATVVES
ncbi:MAG: DUF3037 domain-containing protein [Nibricoccus sp.]